MSCSATEYFLRQCVISTDPEDRLFPFALSLVGADHMVWASDFPHPDAIFPTAVDAFLETAGDLDLREVLWDTPLAFYRLESRFGTLTPVLKEE
jgi:hypothetical protein